MSQVTVLMGGGLHVLLAQTRSSSGMRVYFHHMWSSCCCNLLTQWDWMKRSKKMDGADQKSFSFLLLCSFDSVEMSAWKGWRLNSLSVKVQESLQLKNSQLNLTGSSMTPWRSTLASAKVVKNWDLNFNILVNLLMSAGWASQWEFVTLYIV